MEYLIMYAIFALATGLAALYELFHPIYEYTIRYTNKHSTLYQCVLYTIWVLYAVLFAPMFILVLFIPRLTESFRFALSKTLIAITEEN